MKQIISDLYKQAQALGACKLFTGKEETFDDLARLFLSVQGIEFCTKNHWPSLTTFRAIKAAVGAEKLAEYGIYVDAGNFRLYNPDPRKVVLVGCSTGTVTCTECQRYQVILMHNAKAVVNALNWSVVAIETEVRANAIRNASDNAIIL